MIYSFYNSPSAHSLPVELVILGINHIQEPIQRPEGMAVYQWFYCAKGKGKFIINNHKYIVSEGQGVLVYPNIGHSYQGITKNWTLHFFAFRGPLCKDLMKTLNMPESNVFHFSDPELFLSHIQNLDWLRKRKITDLENEFSKACYSFLLDLSKCITRIDSRISLIEDPIIKRIMVYLEDNYSAPLTLTTLSDYMGLTKEYLCTLFKKQMKQTIMHQLLMIRISHARIFLIQYPDKKSYEIGAMCGIEHPSYFIRVFKKEMGCTPDEYRRL